MKKGGKFFFMSVLKGDLNKYVFRYVICKYRVYKGCFDLFRF